MEEANFDQLTPALDHSPLARKLGIHRRRIDADTAEYELPFDESNVTIADIVHGGAVPSLADCAATAAAWSRVDHPQRYRGLTVDLSLAFMGPARAADLVATATIDRRGNTLCYCTVDIRTAGGEAVARGQVVYKLQRIQEPSEVMTDLFQGRSTDEQMQLLAELERAGANLYRTLAQEETNEERTEKLLNAADRECANADVLSEMTGSREA